MSPASPWPATSVGLALFFHRPTDSTSHPGEGGSLILPDMTAAMYSPGNCPTIPKTLRATPALHRQARNSVVKKLSTPGRRYLAKPEQMQPAMVMKKTIDESMRCARTCAHSRG